MSASVSTLRLRALLVAGLAAVTSLSFNQLANAQASAANQWTWMGGSSSAIYGDVESGIYGTLGTPSADNIPGGRDGAASWTDSSGNLWLFGGLGYDANGTFGYLNDLWEFNPSTNEWTWISGSSAVPPSDGGLSGQPGVYGTLGTPAPGNVPGGRYAAASWTDSSGNLWLFGGTGSDQGCVGCLFNDLWKFNTSTNQWAWMGGSSPATCTTRGVACVWPGVYGTLGVPAAGNVPGSRAWTASWTDRSGNFWFFGGNGTDANGSTGLINDLWEFDPSTNEWAWIGGSSTAVDLPGVYGTLGSPAAGNIPGSRESASSWTDGSGNLWLFGGEGYDANGAPGPLNDLWKYDPSTNQWVWMSGSSTVNCANGDYNCGHAGVYGTLGTPAAGNTPGSHWESASWTDGSGNLWLFGGWGLDANGNGYLLNDLWEFSPSTSEWTWMGGNNTLITETTIASTEFLGWPGVYGTLGTPAAGNIPGSRYSAASWTGKGGNLWLFGGSGVVAGGFSGEVNDFNDLWKYQPSTTYSFPTVATPTFSVAAGTYTAVQTLTITDTTPDATIFYTTDGTAPAFSSAIYTGPLTVSTVSTTETVEAIAVAANYFNSAVVSATYNIDLPVNWYTLTTIASSPNPSSVGEYVTFTATVTPVSNSAVPAGTVQFNAYGAPLGPPVALNGSGVASYTTAALTVPGGSVTATYTPASGSSFNASTSAPLLQAVAGPCPGISSTTLASSQNPSDVGQSVIFTANVAAVAFPLCIAGGGGAPGGTFAPTGLAGSVQFYVNGTAMGSPVPLMGNQGSGGATFTTSTLPAGTDLVTAVFLESNGYVGDSTSAPLSQTVNGSAGNGSFTLTPSAPALTITQGGSGTDVITVTDLGGFSGSVGLAVFGLPNGVTAGFSPGPSTGTSALGLTASSTAVPSTSTLTIVGTSEGLTQAITISLTVNPSQESFALTASAPTVAITQGGSGSDVITVTDFGGFSGSVGLTVSGLPSGVTAVFSPESTTGTSTLELTASSTAATGTSILTITGSSNGLTASVTMIVTVGAPGSFTLAPSAAALAVAQGSSGTDTIAIADQGGFAGSITLAASGLPAGVTASFSPNPATGSSVLTLTASNSATPGIFALTVTGTSATLDATAATSFPIAVVSAGAGSTGPTFDSLTATVTAGSMASYAVTPPSGATGVSVTCLNLPPGATCSYSGSPNELMIATSSTTPAGTYQIMVVFTETVSEAASAGILLPILLLPLAFFRRKAGRRGIWTTVCLMLALMAATAFSIGCSGGISSSTLTTTHQVTSSGVVSLTIK